MKYLLDTNICIYIIKKRPETVLEKFKSLQAGDVAISSVTLYELFYGAYKSAHIDKNINAVKQFTSPMEVLEFDIAAAEICGRIRAEQERKGQSIGAMDLQIAATALCHDLVLVSNNLKEFTRIERLRCANWV